MQECRAMMEIRCAWVIERTKLRYISLYCENRSCRLDTIITPSSCFGTARSCSSRYFYGAAYSGSVKMLSNCSDGRVSSYTGAGSRRSVAKDGSVPVARCHARGSVPTASRVGSLSCRTVITASLAGAKRFSSYAWALLLVSRGRRLPTLVFRLELP